MAKFEIVLPENMREAFATTAGTVFKEFDPSGEMNADTLRKNILFATNGGVTVSCVATYKDHGEDVDNCPPNTIELLDIDAVTCRMTGTALSVTGDNICTLFGHADKAGVDLIEVTPRMTIKLEDFKTLWLVCKYGTQGGFAAVKMTNALNVGGFSWKSDDANKGQFAFDFTGHTSIAAPRDIPFKFYLKPSATEAAQEVNVA